MQILNNPSKVVFQKPLDFNHQLQQKRVSRSSSIHAQKHHPNVIFDVQGNKGLQTKQNNQPAIHIPKKVSFHYSNNKETANDNNYPPNFPQNIKIQTESRDHRRFSQYSRKSNESNGPSNRYRINSTDQRSNVSKDSNKQILKATNFQVNSMNTNHLNYPPTRVIREQTNVQMHQDFPRQRSRSSISSKSSTKHIVETVRQINPDGTKGHPVQIKHRVETQYLTNLNNNRQNYHIAENQNLPKHIIVNHNYHSPNQVRNFYSPQNHPVTYSDRQSQVLNSQYIMHKPNQVAQGKQSTAQKAKYSEVFSYPVRSSGHQHLLTNRVNTQTTQYDSSQQEFRAFPITSQSKFEQTSIKDRYKHMERIQQSNQRQVQNKNYQESSSNQFSNSNFINTKETVYRGYGANITQDAIIQKPAYGEHRNKKYTISSQFYSISQRLIDEIFRNETEKAVLKLNTIDYTSPRKYHSPEVRSYKHFRSTQKKGYIRQNRQTGNNFTAQHHATNQERNMSSQQTLKV